MSKRVSKCRAVKASNAFCYSGAIDYAGGASSGGLDCGYRPQVRTARLRAEYRAGECNRNALLHNEIVDLRARLDATLNA